MGRQGTGQTIAICKQYEEEEIVSLDMTQHIIDNSFRSYVPKEYVQNCKVFKSVSCPISDGTVPFKMLSSFGVGGESEGARDVSDRTGEVGKKRTLSTNQQRTIRR